MAFAVQAGVGLLLLLVSTAALPGALPDPILTPGATNPFVTQSTIHSTICKHGWTKTVRPSSAVTDRIKRSQLSQYGYTDLNLRHYEEDHLISLEVGGAPIDRKNLWPEPYAGACGARVKDRLETWLKAKVCAGAVTLAEAQHELSYDWIAAYRKRIGPLQCK